MVRIDEGAAEAAEAAGTMVDSLDGWRLFRRTAFQSGGGFSVELRLFRRAARVGGGSAARERQWWGAAAP